MTIEAQADEARSWGGESRKPVRSLRDWLDHLSKADRLTILPAGMALEHQIAAVANGLCGRRATLFPLPGGHTVPIVSGIVADRAWIADALGVDRAKLLSTFQQAVLHPIP